MDTRDASLPTAVELATGEYLTRAQTVPRRYRPQAPSDHLVSPFDPYREHSTDGAPCWCGAVPVDPLAGQRAERLQVEVDLETLRKVREAWAECERSLPGSPDSEPVWELLRSLRPLLS